MPEKPFFKILSLYLVGAVFALSFPAQGWAMLVPAERPGARSADLAKVQATLESSVIRQRLLDFGLTPEETSMRLAALSDEQVHRLAANMDRVQAGGDAIGDVIFILLVVLVVIAVLELTGHHIIMKH